MIQKIGSKRSGSKCTPQRFAENGIDLSVISDLTLKDVGVLLGHRRKMQRAIAELRGGHYAQVSVERGPQDRAERRRLTVMFCDLVGSTALSASMDPQDDNMRWHLKRAQFWGKRAHD